MLDEFLNTIDDFLIDRVHQPICDWIRKTFGWSKRIPTAICSSLAGIGFIPLTLFCLSSENIILMIFSYILLLPWVLISSLHTYWLLKEEMYHKNGQSSMMLDENRVRFIVIRTINLTLSIIIFPFMFTVMTITGGDMIIWSYIAGVLAGLMKGYFQACTDLSKGKTVFQKMKLWISTFFARPLPTT